MPRLPGLMPRSSISAMASADRRERRDERAMRILLVLIRTCSMDHTAGHTDPERYAELAYRYADAMEAAALQAEAKEDGRG